MKSTDKIWLAVTVDTTGAEAECWTHESAYNCLLWCMTEIISKRRAEGCEYKISHQSTCDV